MKDEKLIKYSKSASIKTNTEEYFINIKLNFVIRKKNPKLILETWKIMTFKKNYANYNLLII